MNPERFLPKYDPDTCETSFGQLQSTLSANALSNQEHIQYPQSPMNSVSMISSAHASANVVSGRPLLMPQNMVQASVRISVN